MKSNQRQSFSPLHLLKAVCLVVGLASALPPSATAQSTCAPAPSGLLAWWRGEGNALDAANGNHGSLQGGVGFVPAKVGMGFNLDGVDDHVAFPGVVFSYLPTFGIWVKTTAADGAIVDGGKGINPNEWQSWRLSLDGQGRPRFDHARNGVNGYVDITGPSPINDGLFHYLAVTTDHTAKTIKLYVDGAEVATYTEPAGTGFNSWASSEVGAQWLGKGDARGLPEVPPFAGILDEPELYNRPLTAGEITAIFAAGSAGKCVPTCVPPPANLVAWWRGEDNANDFVGGNPGTIENGTGFAAGKVGRAFRFDGLDDHISLRHDLVNPFPASGFTYSFWANVSPTAAGTYQAVISSRVADGNYMNAIRLVNQPAGSLRVQFLADSFLPNAEYAWTTTVPFHRGEGHYITVTYKNSGDQNTDAAIYVDGVPQILATYTAPWSPPYDPAFAPGYNPAAALNLGRLLQDVPQGYFEGRLDEVTFHQRVLSAAEIQSMVNTGSAGMCAPPAPPPFIYNPSFEVPGHSDPNPFIVVGGNRPKYIEGWTAGGPGVDYWRGSPAEITSDGNYSVNYVRGPGEGGTISTLIYHLTPGTAYDLSFDVLQGPLGPETALTVTVDSTSQTYINSAHGVWERRHFVFVAAGPTATLTFSGPVSGAVDGYAQLDNIAIQEMLSVAPTITCPANIVEETTDPSGFNVNFSVSASGPNVPITVVCTSPSVQGNVSSGFHFPVGTTAVNCTATDAVNQTAMCSFTVTVSYSPPGTCAPPPSGLASWWRGEDNAEDQQGANPSTASGNVSYIPGRVGQAFRFDGVSGLVTLGNNSPFRQSSAITYSFWVRLPSSAGVNAGGYAMGTAASLGHGYGGILVAPSGINFAWTPLNPGSDTWIYSDGVTLPTDEWIHVAVSMNFDGPARAIYVNGQPVTTTMTQNALDWHPKTTFHNTEQPDSIGGRFVNEHYYFNGDLDEVDVYSRALDAAEVLAIYNAGSAGKCVPSGNLLVNGSFELPAITQGNTYDFRSGSSIDNWIITTSYRGLTHFNSGYRAISEGQQAVQIETSGDTVSQSFATTPGKQYEVGFDLAAYDQNGGVVTVTVPGASGSFTASGPTYTRHTLTFTATAAQTTLTFVNSGINWVQYPSLDNVSVTEASSALQIVPASANVLVGSSLTFTASGGTPPYTFSTVTMTSGGSITAAGAYTAGSLAGVDTVRVTDSAGANATATVTVNYDACPPLAGATTWWRFDYYLNDSIGANVGTPSGGVSYVSGLNNQALSLNGIDGYAAVPYSASLMPGVDSYTLEGWFRTTGDGAIFSFNECSDGADCFSANIFMGTGQSKLYGYLRSSETSQAGDPYSGQALLGNRVAADGQWHHFALVRDVSAQRNLLYLDGTEETSAAADPGTLRRISDTTGAQPRVLVGASFNTGSATPSYFFNGAVENLVVYHRALTSAEVYTRFRGGLTGNCDPVGTPTVNCPGNITEQSTDPAGKAVTFAAPTASSPNGGVTVVCTPASGSLFPVGTTTVNCTAMDAANQAAMCSFTVSVSYSPPTCVQRPSGLIGWWQGEGNALDAMNANTGTPFGTVGFTAGMVGQAWTFDAPTDYVQFPDGLANFRTTDFSIELWFKTTSTQLGHLFTKRSSCGYGNFIEVRLSEDGRLWFDLDEGASDTWTTIPSSSAVNDGLFHHAVLIRNGIEMRMFIDGALAGSSICPHVLDINNAEPLRVGKSPCGSYNGLVDELSIYDRALSSTEVAALYGGGAAGKCLSAGPLAIRPASANVFTRAAIAFTANGGQPSYTFTLTDNNSGASLTASGLYTAGAIAGSDTVQVTDSLGGNAQATVTVYVPSCSPSPSDIVAWWRGEGDAIDFEGVNNGSIQNGATFASGLVGTAFSFDGVDDEVNIPSNNLLSPWTGGEMTLEAWVYLADWPAPDPLTGQSQRTIAAKAGSSGYEFRIGVSTGGVVGFNTWQELGANHAFAGGGMIDPGKWHHVAGVLKEGQFLRVYVDGAQVGESTTFQGAMTATPSPFRIGHRGDGQHLNGLVDEVTLYHRALTTSEITTIYAAGWAGKCTLRQPTITCPANVTAQATDPAGKLVTFAPPAASSPNGAVTVVCTPSSGSLFPVGTTTVNCTATDTANQTATCSFTVTVSLSPDSPYVYFHNFENDSGPEWSLPGRIRGALELTWSGPRLENGSLTLTLNNLVAATAYVLEFDLYVLDTWDGDDTVNGPDYFNVAIDGTQRFHETFSNSNGEPPDHPQSFPGAPEGGRRFIAFSSTAVDAIYRKIQIPFVAGGASATINFSGQGLEPYPNETWAIDNVGVRRTLNLTPASSSVSPGGVVNFNASGGSGALTFAILQNNSGGTIDPASGEYHAGNQCGVTDTIRVTDANNQTANATVTIVDAVVPVITACAPGRTLPAGANCQAALPDLTSEVTATDACGAPVITQTPAAGTLLASGTHPVTLRATDAAGNASTCDVIVTIADSTVPVITTCAPARTLSAGGNCQAVLPDLTGQVIATDNCGAPALTQSPAAGNSLGLGAHTVTLRATDAAGNASLCEVIVMVADSTPPVITCPANIVAQSTGPAGASVSFNVSASDACAMTPSLSCNPPSGSTFPIGSTMINCTATDNAGNIASCSFTVTVNDLSGGTCPPTDAVAWYRADGNTLDSVGGHDGFFIGDGPYYSGGHGGGQTFGQSFWVRGGDSLGTSARFVNVPAIEPSTALDFSGSSFTWELWALPNWVDGNPILIEQGGDFSTEPGYPNSGIRIRLVQDIRDLRFASVGAYIDSPNPSVISVPGAVQAGQWNHIVFVLNHANNQARLYVNGTLVGSAVETRTPNVSFFRELMIGGPLLANAAFGLNGFMDDIVLYKRALTDSEVRTRYMCGQTISCPPPTSGLLSWWRGENNTLDQLGNNDGVAAGGAFWLTYWWGRSERAFDFADSHFVRAQRQVQNDFTLAAWMRSAVASRTGSQFWQGDGFIYADAPGANYDFGTAILNGKFAFGIGQPGQPDQTIQSSTKVNSGQWTHVAAVRSGTVIKVYVNGAEEASLDTGISAPLNAQPLLYLGGNFNDNRFYTGLMDEVMVYGRALTAQEILGIYQCNTLPAPTITCPANITEQAADPAGKVVNFATPNASSPNGSVTVVCTPASGSVFPIGTTTVNCTATDTANQFARCSVTVTATASDTSPPTITTCVPDQTLSTTVGCLAVLPDLRGLVAANDGEGPITITQSPAAGSVVGVGPLTLRFTVKDQANNEAICSAIINVVDTTPPVVTCPPRQKLVADASGQATLPFVGPLASGDDNCGLATASQDPPAGTRLAIGRYNVTYTVTDQAGNSTVCSPQVEVVPLSFTVSGVIRLQGSMLPVPGVPVELRYTLNRRTTTQPGRGVPRIFTDISGRFSFEVPVGCSGSVYAKLRNYRFTPYLYRFEKIAGPLSQYDFVATPAVNVARAAALLDSFGAAEPDLQFPLIAGLLLDTNGLPLAGASIELSGDSNRTTNTSATGEFLFDALPEDGTFTLAPVVDGRIFDPVSMAVSNLFGAEIAVFVEQPLEPLPMPVISIRPDARFDGQLTITWPGDALDYILESTPSLPNPEWQRAGEPQLQDIGQVVVPLASPTGQRFFRLRAP